MLFAEVRVPADSHWFCGHFPGEPILPGIAQLGMVYDLLARAADPKRPIKSVSRVRFKQAIRPDDRLKIFASFRKEEVDSYSFRIMIEEEVVCSGVMTLQGAPDRAVLTGSDFRRETCGES